MNNIVNTIIAPISPISAVAAAGTTKPIWACCIVISTSSATAVRPIVVASVNGIANQQSPPSKKPFTVDPGWAAIALCQYAWSTNTVPKFPTMLMIPNIKPPAEAIVKKAPAALPSTGLISAACTNLSYIPSIPPVMSVLMYTAETNVKMTTNMIIVCM